MSFDSELCALNPSRLQDAATVIGEQVRHGRNAADLLDPLEEDRGAYEVMYSLGDMWSQHLNEDATNEQIDPLVAAGMIKGVRLAISTLVEYAKAEALERELSGE